MQNWIRRCNRRVKQGKIKPEIDTIVSFSNMFEVNVASS
jgi:hypothetical protein